MGRKAQRTKFARGLRAVRAERKRRKRVIHDIEGDEALTQKQ